MPAQTGKALSIAGKFGQRAVDAAKKHAKDPIRYGRMQLPPGIINGVAKLSDIYIGEYEKGTGQKQLDGSSAEGQYFIRIAMTALEPKSVVHNGTKVPVEGAQDSQILPLCEKGVSFRGRELPDIDACIAEAQNEIRMITGDDFDVSNLDTAIATLRAILAKKDAKPLLFLFSTNETYDPTRIDPKTKKPFPPRTWVNWLGSRGLNGYTVSQSPDVTAANNGSDVTQSPDDTQSNDVNSGSISDIANDPDELLKFADSEEDGDQNVAARERLKEMTQEQGMSAKDFDVKNWVEIVAWLKENSGDKAVGNDAAGDDEVSVEVGGVFLYKYRDDKGNPVKDVKTKREKKAVEVEVLSVDENAGTVTVKDQDTGKTILGSNKKALKIPVDHLEPIEPK